MSNVMSFLPNMLRLCCRDTVSSVTWRTEATDLTVVSPPSSAWSYGQVGPHGAIRHQISVCGNRVAYQCCWLVWWFRPIWWMHHYIKACFSDVRVSNQIFIFTVQRAALLSQFNFKHIKVPWVSRTALCLRDMLHIFLRGLDDGLFICVCVAHLCAFKVPVNRLQSQWNRNGLSVAQYPMRFSCS